REANTGADGNYGSQIKWEPFLVWRLNSALCRRAALHIRTGHIGQQTSVLPKLLLFLSPEKNSGKNRCICPMCPGEGNLVRGELQPGNPTTLQVQTVRGSRVRGSGFSVAASQ